MYDGLNTCKHIHVYKKENKTHKKC